MTIEKTETTKETQADLYSRQLYTIGKDAMKVLETSTVALSRADGLATEIGKNLALMGVKSVVILDNEKVKPADLTDNFALSTKDIGRKRVANVAAYLAELNPYCSVDPKEASLEQLTRRPAEKLGEFLVEKKVNVLVLVNEHAALLPQINEICRENAVKLIVANSHGLFGWVGNDFGPSTEVSPTSSKENASGMVVRFAPFVEDNTTFAVCEVNEEENHNLLVGDRVKFCSLPDSLKDHLAEKEFEVTSTPKCNVFVIRFGDELMEEPRLAAFGFQELNDKATVTMDKLGDLFENPETLEKKLHPSDFCKGDRVGIYARILELLSDPKLSVKPHKPKYAEEVATKKFPKSDQLEIIKGLLRCARFQLAPVNSVIGGIAAQEAMKALTKKFLPIDQVLVLDFSELDPKLTENNEDFRPGKDRYSHIEAILGRKFAAMLRKKKGLMIGAGAIGCELLKNFALTGLFCADNGLEVVDDDTIERSNLSRQFLFRERNIGEPKATAAIAAAGRMNPDLKAKGVVSKFDAKFKNLSNTVESKDVLFAALDNVEARLFLDNQALFFQKPMLDSGTMGLKGSCQPVIPHLSENWGAARDPPEKSIPVCTLKHYPFKPEHVIHWARDLFDGEFRANPEVAAKVQSEGAAAIESPMQKSSLVLFYRFLLLRIAEHPDNLPKAACFSAADLFVEIFSHDIKQLAHNFPEDAKTKQGTPFWSGTKRFPQAMEFDLADANCLNFVEAGVRLKCELLGVIPPENVTDLLADYEPAEYRPKEVELPSGEDKKQAASAPSVSEDEVEKAISALCDVKFKSSLEFEKDDDKNGHIRFIAAASALRARNYRIEGDFSEFEVKRIAGKIIPAIATTTAMVAGLAVLESFKFLLNLDIDSYKMTSVDLSNGEFVMFAPAPPKRAKLSASDEGKTMLGNLGTGDVVELTPWDVLRIPRPTQCAVIDMTVANLEDLFRNCGWTLAMLVYGTQVLYNNYAEERVIEQQRSKTISHILIEEGIIEREPKPNEIVRLEVFVDDVDGKEVELPSLALRF